MPKAIQILAKMPELLKKKVKGDPVTDCSKCFNEVINAIQNCSSETIDDIIDCAMSIEDCMVCVCDILESLGIDAADCPKK